MNEPDFAAQLSQDLDHEDLMMVLDVFRTDVQRLTAELSAAARAPDAVAFRRTAHGLAGAAGAVGAADLERTCRRAMALAADSAAAVLDAALAEVCDAGTQALAAAAALLRREGRD